MNINKSSLFWGILLIGGGLLALAQQMGYIDQHSEQLWMWVFALVSLLALVNYALSSWKQWGWLFPTGIFGGLVVTVVLAKARCRRVVPVFRFADPLCRRLYDKPRSQLVGAHPRRGYAFPGLDDAAGG